MGEKHCNGCGTHEKTHENKSIPYVAFEASEARHERREKRYISLIAFLITLLVGTNIGWLLYESSMEEVTESYTIEQEAETGSNNSIINGGVIN